MGDGKSKKVFLSSVRPPRAVDNTENQAPNKRMRPLYDIPYMYEAREFLRTKLIGKKVHIHFMSILIYNCQLIFNHFLDFWSLKCCFCIFLHKHRDIFCFLAIFNRITCKTLVYKNWNHIDISLNQYHLLKRNF